MEPLIVFAVFCVVLAIVVPWLGADSRDSRDWKRNDGDQLLR